MTNTAPRLVLGHFLIDWSLGLGHWSFGRGEVLAVVWSHLGVRQTEEVEQAVEDEAAKLGTVRYIVFTRLCARPVAGDVDFAEQVRLARHMRFVAVEGYHVSGPVAFQELAVDLVDSSVRYKDEVDDRCARLEVARHLPAESSDVGAQAAVLRAVDTGLQCSEAQLAVSR